MILRNGILHNDDGTPYVDVLYGHVPAEQLHVDLINTASFQRMGGILQNGFSYLDFPKMKNHTRLGHSIGAFHKTSQILDTRKKRNVVHPAYQRVARVSALLHDIGHASPFSHALEPVFGNQHEKVSKEIIAASTDVTKVLIAHGFTDKDFDMLINDRGFPGFLGKILDGSVDIDKQDYLPRDAYYAGKRLGTDFDRVAQSLIVAFNETGNPEICIDKKYLADVDQMISERRWMYQNVYFSDAPSVGESAVLPLLTEYIPFLIKNGCIAASALDPLFEKVFTNGKNITLPEYMQFDRTTWKKGLETLTQTSDPLLRYMCANEGEDAIRDFTVTYSPDNESAYVKLLAETFGDENAKSFGLTKRTASWRTYREGGMRVAYPDGTLRELANQSASLREAANTQITDCRICENPTIIAIEKAARLNPDSALGKFLVQAERTSSDIDRNNH